MEDYTGTHTHGRVSMEKHPWRNMKKTFWEPKGTRGKWDNYFAANYGSYRDAPHLHRSKTFKNGMERELFIREQNSIVRKCSSDEEYRALYDSVLTLMS